MWKLTKYILKTLIARTYLGKLIYLIAAGYVHPFIPLFLTVAFVIRTGLKSDNGLRNGIANKTHELASELIYLKLIKKREE